MERLADMFAQIDWPSLLRTGIELFIVIYAGIWVWGRIRRTQAERLVKGLMVLSIICLISYFSGFTIITSILKHLIPVALLAILIIFQPEIRRGLGYLGRSRRLKFDLSLASNHADRSQETITEIIAAVRELSRTRTGALLVVEPPDGALEHLSASTPVNADVSANLLLTIFFPRSPLHDGAVVLRQDKIVAAGVILPMTDNPKLSYRYGTRHRAAIGLTEMYDGLCIVVSEETGTISAATRGMLVRYNTAEDLSAPLSFFWEQTSGSKVSSALQSIVNLLGFARQDKGKEKAQEEPGAADDITCSAEPAPTSNIAGEIETVGSTSARSEEPEPGKLT